MSKEFWTYEHWDTDKICDEEFATMDEAISHAEEKFEREVQDYYEPRDGEDYEERVFLLRCRLDEKGNYIILERVKSIVEYTHYESGFYEHFNQSDYI